MVRVALSVLLGLACLGLMVNSSDDGDLKTLTSRLLRFLVQDTLEKRGFYNVVRKTDGVKVYFQFNSKCKDCAHTVMYGNDKWGTKILQTKGGEKFLKLGAFPFDQDLTIMVCENIELIKDRECRYAELPAGKETTMFSTSKIPLENAIDNGIPV